MSGEFVPNELVWVKLGGIFWPSVVKDKAECDEFLEALKRDPIVVVEFFDKKLHDVHNKNHIYRYNCEEKEEIMLKSLQMTKNKVDLSEDFKKDIITAEKLTAGDINILSREKFILPGSCRQKYDQLFGSSKKAIAKQNGKRKGTKSAEPSPKVKASKYSDIFPESSPKVRRPAAKPKKPSRPASEAPRPNITHPRFITENDHQIRILAPAGPETAASSSSAAGYRCCQCGFTTARLNVLVLHNKTHVAAAAAAVKPATAKRKNSELGEAARKPKKRPADPDGAAPRPAKSARPGDTTKKTATPTKSAPSTPKKSAPSTPKKLSSTPKKSDPKSPKKTPAKSPGKKSLEAEQRRTPAKTSPLKPAGSSRPMLLEDWDEDDDEEAAERLKIQSEIDRFIKDKRHAKEGEEEAVVKQEQVDVKEERLEPEGATPLTVSHLPAEEEKDEVAVKREQRERNDALLQAAVDDVLADTAPVPVPSLPGEPESPPRPRPVRVCPAGSPTQPGRQDEVSSSRPAATAAAAASSTGELPPNLQILSVPGVDGAPDTYVLVSVDERGNVQTVNPLDNLGGLGGLGSDTLLAYEVAQEDGSTRTAYLNPAALSTSADIRQLLGGEGRVDSTTPVPDSSGK